MPENIRALIVILSIATCVFYYAKKAIGPMLQPKEFIHWRNAWFIITLIAFLSQNFWVFLLLSFLILLYFKKSEQNKFALYFALLIIIPTITARIPSLIDLNYPRILSLSILLPFFLTFKATKDVPKYGDRFTEKIMFCYLILSTLLSMRGGVFTEMLRYAFYGFTDIFLPYFAASRAIKSFDQLKKVMIAFVLACLVAAVIGAFEFRSSWLLYNSLQNALHVDWDMGRYLGRGENIRAIASLGHSIILGFVMMVGLGFYLFIAPSIKNKYLRLAGLGIIAVGLLSSLSRGPWVGTAVMFFMIIALSQKMVRNFALFAIAIVIAIQALSVIPGGNKFLDLIPFVGETDKSNIEYRQDLFDNSLIIIQRYPLFGTFNPKEEPELKAMVQGEGIIDIVNTYLSVTLFNGLVGLSLLLGFFSMVLITAFTKMRKIADKKSEAYKCGVTLISTLLASLFTISTVSSIGVIPTIYWVLTGLIFSYVRLTTNANSSIIKDNGSAEKLSYPTFRLKLNE